MDWLLIVLRVVHVGSASAVRNELTATGGVPSEEQRQRVERTDRRMRLANRIGLPLILFAGLTMAIGRYL